MKLTKITEQYKISNTEAEHILVSFKEVSDKIKVIDNEVKSFDFKQEITPEACKEAKRLRLMYVKARILGDNIHKKTKEQILLRGRAIDGVRNLFKLQITEREEQFTEIERHYENIEKEKKERLKQERIDILGKYNVSLEDIGYLKLEDMNVEVWNTFYKAKKQEYEISLKVEEERIEKEKKEKVLQERKNEIAPYSQFIHDIRLSIDTTEEEFQNLLKSCKEQKKEYDKTQEKIRLENERIKKEQSLLIEKQEKEKKEQEAILQLEREKQEKLEKELKQKEEEELRIKIEKEMQEKEEERQKKNQKYKNFLLKNKAEEDNENFIIKRIENTFILYKKIDSIII